MSMQNLQEIDLRLSSIDNEWTIYFSFLEYVTGRSPSISYSVLIQNHSFSYKYEEYVNRIIELWNQLKPEGTKILLKIYKIILWILLIVYVFVLIKYLILDRMIYQNQVGRNFNLYPFNSIRAYLLHKDNYNFNTWALNLFGNMIMLVPFSILMPLLFSMLRKTNIFIVCLFVFNIGIEVFQYFSGFGSFDVDDLILNSSGALVAYIILRVLLLFKFAKKFTKSMWLIYRRCSNDLCCRYCI